MSNNYMYVPSYHSLYMVNTSMQARTLGDIAHSNTRNIFELLALVSSFFLVPMWEYTWIISYYAVSVIRHGEVLGNILRINRSVTAVFVWLLEAHCCKLHPSNKGCVILDKTMCLTDECVNSEGHLTSGSLSTIACRVVHHYFTYSEWKALKWKPSAQFDWNIVTFGLKTPLHALGEHIGMKTELYQTQNSGGYLQSLIPAQVALINTCSKRLIGASLSEPHLDELAGAFLWYIHVYIYIYTVESGA